jgi:hypothetical protein
MVQLLKERVAVFVKIGQVFSGKKNQVNENSL